MSGGADVPHDARRTDVIAHPSTLEQLGHLGDQILGSRASDGLASHQDDVVSFHPTRRDLADRCPKTRRARFRCTAPPIFLPATSANSPGTGSDKQYHPLPVDRLRIIEDALDRPGTHRCGQPETLAAALAAASGEDRPAGTGPHPQTETVRLRTAARVRLVRTLSLGHPRIPSRKEGRQRRRPKGKYGNIPVEGLTTESASRRFRPLLNPVL